MRPRVLLTAIIDPNDPNPYIPLFAQAVGADVELLPFDWSTAVFGEYDIVHGQWLEYIFRGGNAVKSMIKFGLASAWLARLHFLGVPIVETKHNLRPHQRGNVLERALLKWWAKLPKTTVYLNAAADNDMTDAVVILHGAYPVLVPAGDPAPDAPLFFFGRLSAYKGLDTLLQRYSEWSASTTSAPDLLIWGRPDSESFRHHLSALANQVPGLKTRFGYVPEQELHEQIAASRGVILPYPTMYNSGALLLSLCVGAPVLVPRTSATESLQSEFGPMWVSLFDTEVGPEDLDSFARNPRTDDDRRRLADAMQLRRWDRIGEQHARLYRHLLAGRAGSQVPLPAAVAPSQEVLR